MFGKRSTFCESIKVNQVGYSRLATSRFANFGAWLGDAGGCACRAHPATRWSTRAADG
ncbi:hypothetical protein G4G28_11970 [Massilia sp. Dwa41.01b]|uniref:hypothetical protein n=1 Tax=Massilia sp. Dwa41.01b TaxID=2709302 RepID=UPI0016013F3C|nr:hypothetical protein [Massilia sp. Dwa41.01b]QNA89015.1 hypothetical protein G4G28_11970 [Massilia sp. Dwa41.01b]